MTEHLRNLVDPIDGGSPDSAVNPPPTAEAPAASPATPPPSLSDVLEGSGDSPSVPTPDDAAFNLRQNLENRLGIAADSYDDDNAAFEDFATALGQASEVLNSEDYQNFQTHQEAFQKYQEQQAAPVTPEPASAVSEPPASSFTTANISEDAQLLAQQNLITRGEDGTWTPKQPAFQSFADEYNKHDVAVRTNVMKFSQDPTGFVTKLIEQNQAPAAESDTVKSLQDELSAIKQQLADQATLKSTNTIDQWRAETTLRDESGALTPYAKEYMRWEQRVRQESPNLSPIQAHDKVIDSLKFAGITPEQAASATEPKTLATPRESMAGKAKKRAATNSNGNGHNRLQEYAASAPASDPGVPKGKAGLPSLSGLIAQSEISLTE